MSLRSWWGVRSKLFQCVTSCRNEASASRVLLRKSAPCLHNSRALSTAGVGGQDPWKEQQQLEISQKEKARREDDEDEATKTKILDSSLKFVRDHGWSQAALASGAEALGHPSVVAGLFPAQWARMGNSPLCPGGGVDLVLHHVGTSNKQLDNIMKMEVEQLDKDGVKINVGSFIRKFVEERLRMNEEFLVCDRWGEAMAILAHPANACDSVGCIQELCDDIWHRAGDKSADMNWYSKRISLAAVYGATELFMVQDKSEDFKDTWQFLDRRFQDLRIVQSAGVIPQELGKMVSGVFVTSKNMMGFN